MLRIIRFELYKLFTDKKLFIIALLMAIFTLSLAIALKPLGSTSDGLLPSLINGQSFPIFALSLALKELTPIFLIISVAGIICDEQTVGTLKLALLKPITRGELLLAKIVAVAVNILVLLGVSVIAGYLSATLLFGWGDTMMIFTKEYSSLQGIIYTIGAYLVSFLPFFALGVFVLFLSMILPSSGVVIGVGLGIHFALFLLGIATEKLDPYTLHSYYDLGVAIFGRFDKIHTMTGILVTITTILFFSLLSYAIF